MTSWNTCVLEQVSLPSTTESLHLEQILLDSDREFPLYNTQTNQDASDTLWTLDLLCATKSEPNREK